MEVENFRNLVRTRKSLLLFSSNYNDRYGYTSVLFGVHENEHSAYYHVNNKLYRILPVESACKKFNELISSGWKMNI